jgi:hypothetical protein
MDQSMKDKLAMALGISPDKQDVLDVGSQHHYRCRCEVCRQWWKSMGPESAEEPYGPFEIPEIEDGTEDGNSCKSNRLDMEDNPDQR